MKKSNSINIIVTIAYLLLIGLLVFEIFGLTDRYNKEELEMITDIERDMRIALEQETDEQMITNLSEAIDKYSFDIVITREDEVVYNTIPYTLGENLLNRMHTSTVARQSQGHFDRNGEELFIWYSVYRLNNSSFVNNFLGSVVALVLILTALIALTVFIMVKNLFKPLKKIEQSLTYANTEEFDAIETSDDKINENFKMFISKYEEDLSYADSKHTELEKQLQAKQEYLKNIINISNVMINHIESSIQLIEDENSDYFEKHHNIEAVKEMTNFNIETNENLLRDIKTIQNMLNQNKGFDLQIREIDIVALIMDVVKTFHKQMYAKGLLLDLDVPTEAIIESEETTLILLINNILMNMVLYTTKNTELKIIVDQDEEKTSLQFINESEPANIERMRDSEHLFNTNRHNDEYVYSSGNGLFITKELTNIVNGEYSVDTDEETVTISVTLKNKL